MDHITDRHGHIASARPDPVLVVVTVLLGLVGGAAEVMVFNWLNTSNIAWGNTALYGNGAFIVPALALPMYTLLAFVLGWRWHQRYDAWWAVPLALALFIASIVVGAALAILL